MNAVSALPAPPASVDSADVDGADDDEPERERILQVLAQCGGNQSQAAKQLGMSRNTLLARLDRYGVPRPRKRGAASPRRPRWGVGARVGDGSTRASTVATLRVGAGGDCERARSNWTPPKSTDAAATDGTASRCHRAMALARADFVPGTGYAG